ncbi:cysteine proteinase inhibitor 4-like [Musa acuminata AAA Group]|uniref:cysteine proteinase inhibitor 4-like n=1 Tax=Musa acuminata AAA Group TaxID=214697 RepID=UPI0031E32426
MASLDRCLLLLVLLFSGLIVSTSSAYSGRMVGARTEVQDVETNKEVQDLGLFSVDEYNRRLALRGARLLTFSRVAAAQRQVVSGIKYYLQVVAAVKGTGEEGQQHRTFDAVVIVKPWLSSRSLVSFAPRRPALNSLDNVGDAHLNVR